MNLKRRRIVREGMGGDGPVVYWMQRDQRVHDNWALLLAQEYSIRLRRPLVVVFTLVDDFGGAPFRHYDFMLKGLMEVEEELKKYAISFHLLYGSPPETLSAYLKEIKCGFLVTDFSPLNIVRSWKQTIQRTTVVPWQEVDAHNIVPYTVASDKAETGAYTLRPKIQRKLSEFLDPFPAIVHQPHQLLIDLRTDWDGIIQRSRFDRSVAPVAAFRSGSKAALRMVDDFFSSRLNKFSENRNDPTLDAQSNLSPYLHFGQVSAQRIAMQLQRVNATISGKETFEEEFFIRRELSDNFCFFNPDYQTVNGFPEWARTTLNEHLADPREHLYTRDQFESASTDDPLWNAAQRQLLQTGKMHGYMRMYWAKKILEWTSTPEEALEIGIYLNDRYELDGRDPNGYTGLAWAIGGVHDRPFPERPVFGKIRYMNYSGCAGKFNVKKYIQLYDESGS